MRVVSVVSSKQHLYTVTPDDGQSGAIDKIVWEHSGFSTESTLTDHEWVALCELSQTHRARERALYYLSTRDYGSGELEQKLIKAGFERELATQTVSRLVQSGLINDVRYASMLAADMQERKLYPKRRIAMALRDKGFSSHHIEEALSALSDDEEKQALELLRKKRYNKVSDSAVRERALGMLARYGFSYAVSKRAWELLDEEDC